MFALLSSFCLWALQFTAMSSRLKLNSSAFIYSEQTFIIRWLFRCLWRPLLHVFPRSGAVTHCEDDCVTQGVLLLFLKYWLSFNIGRLLEVDRCPTHITSWNDAVFVGKFSTRIPTASSQSSISIDFRKEKRLCVLFELVTSENKHSLSTSLIRSFVNEASHTSAIWTFEISVNCQI